ncbi:MAG: iron-sulfur cluster assembly accessory protein [Elusimicrobiota bacterium]
MLTVSPAAAGKIKQMLQAKGMSDGFLRMKVTPGGCSGMSYQFDLVAEAVQGDLLVSQDGAKVLVDGMALFYLKGSILDYTSSLMQSGFAVTNPNAKSACSCGTSFGIE